MLNKCYYFHSIPLNNTVNNELLLGKSGGLFFFQVFILLDYSATLNISTT